VQALVRSCLVFSHSPACQGCITDACVESMQSNGDLGKPVDTNADMMCAANVWQMVVS
jgi:hypothetical protein